MKNVSSNEPHFLSCRPEQLHAKCNFQTLNCLCWFFFQVLPECGENRHKHEINSFRLSMPGSDALTLWMNKTIFWVNKGKKSLHEVYMYLCQCSSAEQSMWLVGHATAQCHVLTMCLCWQSLTVVDLASTQRKWSRRLEIYVGTKDFRFSLTVDYSLELEDGTTKKG